MHCSGHGELHLQVVEAHVARAQVYHRLDVACREHRTLVGVLVRVAVRLALRRLSRQSFAGELSECPPCRAFLSAGQRAYGDGVSAL